MAGDCQAWDSECAGRPDVSRRVLILGAGPLGIRIGEQIQKARIENMQCVGYVDDEKLEKSPADLWKIQ